MEKVKAKKHLGQHFLKDESVAEKIAALVPADDFTAVIEIGPGMGVLSKYLYPAWKEKLVCVEIDRESVSYLSKAPWAQGLRVVEADFLQIPLSGIFENGKAAVIGNYPYNISSQIAFKVMEHCDRISWFGGMFQHEVAARFAARHGNKEYGVTSVLLQSLYDCSYQFTVEAGAFIPPPKVKSGVLACTRRADALPCSFKSLSLIVKTAFNQRRKTMHNAMKSLVASTSGFELPEQWKGLRAEQLSVRDFIDLAVMWESRK